jgi:hypothetical protein
MEIGPPSVIGASMRVIFLDIDGVLVVFDADTPGYTGTDEPFHRPAVDALNTLTAQTGCKIVISSMWRVLENVNVRQIFKEEGITGEIVGETPSVGSRSEEIAAWLAAAPEPIESFVIIDDIAIDLSKTFPGRVVKTKATIGLDAGGLKQARKILDTPWTG